MVQLLPEPLLATEAVTNFALKFYALPESLPAELAVNRAALILCVAVDVLVPATAALVLLGLVVRWWQLRNTPTLVFPPSPLKQQQQHEHPVLTEQRSFTSLAKQLTRGGVQGTQQQAARRAVPKVNKDILESFDVATAPSSTGRARISNYGESSSSPEALSSSSSRRFVSPGTGLSQRVDIFDPSSPVYHSPVILPIRPAYLSATKTATTATSIAAAARSSNTPTMRSARDSEDVVGNLLDDLAAAGDDGNNWTTEVSRDLAATIMSPVGKSPDGVPAIKALPPLPSQTEGLRISTVASKEIEPVRPEFIERWSEASILVRSPSDQITAVEEFGQVHLSAVQTSGASVSAAATAASSSKGSPSKAKFDELLSEIDKLTIENGIPEEKDERELKRVETRRQEAKPIVDRLSTSRLPELPKASDVEMTDATSAPSETNQTPESQISRGRPGHPLSAKLPMRVPVKPKAPEDSQAGFPGLWYRLPASSRTPGQSPVDHTPKSLAKMPGRVTMARGSSPTERGRVGRDRSPGRSPSPKRSNTETPPSGLPKSSGHISQAASADRQLYYVRSNLPVNSNRVNDLFAGILRGEGKE